VHLDLITLFMGANVLHTMIARLFDRAREPKLREERRDDQEAFRAQSEIMRDYPLLLHPTQLAARHQVSTATDTLGFPALLVIVAPPICRDPRPSPDATALVGRELRIDELLRRNLQPFFSSNRIDLQTGIWRPGTPHRGEAAVAYLHQVFGDIPAVVVQTMIEGDRVYLTAGHWNPWRLEYAYEELGVFLLSETLDVYARQEAVAWKERRAVLVGQSRPLTDDERHILDWNIPLSDEQQRDEDTDITGRNYNYKRLPRHFERLLEELAVCISFSIGWVADAYHRVGVGRRPLLPHILPKLLRETGHQGLVDKSLVTLHTSFLTLQEGRMHASFTEEIRDQIAQYKEAALTLRRKLPPEKIGPIEEVIQRLERLTFCLAAFGATNAGKSSLLNSLLGYERNDPKRPFTNSPVAGTWNLYSEETNGVPYQPDSSIDMLIFDTPGIAGDNPEHIVRAKQIAASADIILYVVWQQVQGEEQNNAIRELLTTGKPMIVAINQVDRMRMEEILATEEALLSKVPELDPNMVVRTAGDPIHGRPQLDDLINRLIDVIRNHQGALITRTVEQSLERGAEAMAVILQEELRRFEAEQQAKVQAMKDRLRAKDAAAEEVISRWSKWAAGAAAIIPFGLDALSTTGFIGKMFADILAVYEKKLDRDTLLALGTQLLKSFWGVLAVSGATLAAYKALTVGTKTNPFTYAVGMTLDGVGTYFISYVVGRAFAYYCSNNLSWGAHRSATEALRFYIKENIETMFLDKLPDQVRKKLNIDPSKL